MIRQYAAGEITWHTLRERGFENYLDVLAGLGKLGLRPPVVPMEEPNLEARRRGRASCARCFARRSRDGTPWPESLPRLIRISLCSARSPSPCPPE